MVSRGTDRKRPTRDLFSRFSNIFRDLPPTAHADSLVPRRPPLPKVPAASPPHPAAAPLRVNPHPSELASELHAAVTLLLPYFDSLQLSYSETAKRGQNSVNPKTEPPHPRQNSRAPPQTPKLCKYGSSALGSSPVSAGGLRPDLSGASKYGGEQSWKPPFLLPP